MPPFNRRCCCGCEQYADTFNRADSSTISDEASEIAGNWTISSNTLRTADTNAICLFTIDGYETETAAHVKTTIKGTAGDEFRIGLDYIDSANYLYALARVETSVAAADGAIEIHRVTAGTDELLTARHAEIAAAQSFIFTFKVSEDTNWEISMSEAMVVPFNTTTTQVHYLRYAATISSGLVMLGTGGSASSSLQFDDLEIAYRVPDATTGSAATHVCHPITTPCTILQTSRIMKTIGTQWDDEAGAVSLAGDVITLGNTGARALLLTRNPLDDPHLRTSFNIENAADGDVFRLRFHQTATDTFGFIRFSFGSTAENTLVEIGTVIAGTENVHITAITTAGTGGGGYDTFASLITQPDGAVIQYYDDDGVFQSLSKGRTLAIPWSISGRGDILIEAEALAGAGIEISPNLGLLIWKPGAPTHCGTPPEIELRWCSSTDDTGISEYDLTIAGVANNTCSDCGDFNDTFSLVTGGTNGVPTYWYVFPPGSGPCGVLAYEAFHSFNPVKVFVRYRTSTGPVTGLAYADWGFVPAHDPCTAVKSVSWAGGLIPPTCNAGGVSATLQGQI